MLDSAKRYLSLTVVTALAVSAAHANQGSEHAVFVMTNDADSNEIYSYAQNPQGRLENERIYPTAGRGSGGTVDPLATQGSLSLSSDGNWLLASNAGTSNLSGFSLGANGGLTSLSGTLAASNPTGSTNIDIAASADSQYVYTLNTATGTIGVFAVNASNGQLTNLGVSGHLPAKSGANGMVAH
jgi:6-phosphogluconolactonase (cycloisomerase 2 family)